MDLDSAKPLTADFITDSVPYLCKGVRDSAVFCFHYIIIEIKLGCRMFHKVITAPSTEAELEKVAKIYEVLGMPGAVGSTDCTHIPLGKCPVSWKNQCTGKEGFPTLSYSMTCDHTRRIMACSGGFPGSYNDKTIARYDSFISDISGADLFKNFTYTLQTKSGPVQKKGKRLFISSCRTHNVATAAIRL